MIGSHWHDKILFHTLSYECLEDNVVFTDGVFNIKRTAIFILFIVVCHVRLIIIYNAFQKIFLAPRENGCVHYKEVVQHFIVMTLTSTQDVLFSIYIIYIICPVIISHFLQIRKKAKRFLDQPCTLDAFSKKQLVVWLWMVV